MMGPRSGSGCYVSAAPAAGGAATACLWTCDLPSASAPA
eukprot:CAMPEP_0115557026 /NCGR_PEP_ID=MMETSP0271-20121206/98690_1 /TAXON_ID=71861 /ORGANISM="Scrippsiella trochoidea, Strain CCMP3099" /LENGTH=38 /DNA_ID= /DNA_START= /DNA_END= /DNA_ORIENTATION=